MSDGPSAPHAMKLAVRAALERALERVSPVLVDFHNRYDARLRRIVADGGVRGRLFVRFRVTPPIVLMFTPGLIVGPYDFAVPPVVAVAFEEEPGEIAPVTDSDMDAYLRRGRGWVACSVSEHRRAARMLSEVLSAREALKFLGALEAVGTVVAPALSARRNRLRRVIEMMVSVAAADALPDPGMEEAIAAEAALLILGGET